MEEEIPYRKQKLKVKTIPKNTLLFRLSKSTENDLRGVPIENSENRCIIPNFNVFFHLIKKLVVFLLFGNGTNQ